MIKNETLLVELADKYRIPVRILNILLSQDVTTVGQLIDFVPNRQMRNMGKKSLCEILELQDELSRELEQKKDDKDIDWEERRFNLTSKLMIERLSRTGLREEEIYRSISFAVSATDALIAELKKGGNP